MYQDGVQHLEQMSTSYIVIPFDFTTPSLTYNTYLNTTLTLKTIRFEHHTHIILIQKLILVHTKLDSHQIQN